MTDARLSGTLPDCCAGGEGNEAMTKTEGGRKGGESTRDEYGREFYQEIGRKGGNTTAARHPKTHYQRLGAQGGATVKRLVAAGRRAEEKDPEPA